MCVTSSPAKLSATILLAHALPDGRNVVGYQNRATNQSNEPNAMLLPFPAELAMSRENCIDLSSHPKLFHSYALLLHSGTRGRTSSPSPASRGVEVFDSGSYTVVLAANAREIPTVLDAIPAHKRPRLNPELLEAYAVWYPGWTVALCCWDGAIKAEPMLWWYEPMAPYRDSHFLPGLDSHDGRIPNLANPAVDVDHTILVGDASGGVRNNADYILRNVEPELRVFLPNHVYGVSNLKTQMKNGDWVVPKHGWSQENAAKRLLATRVSPPGVMMS